MNTALKLNNRIAGARKVARFTEQISHGRIRRRGGGGGGVDGPFTVSGLNTDALQITAGYRSIIHITVPEFVAAASVSVAALADGSYWLHMDLTYGPDDETPGTWSGWTTTLVASLLESETKRIHRRALFTVASGEVTALLQTKFGIVEEYDAGEDCSGV